MKILHTSDWHIGHVLYTNDRSREQQSFLEQLADIVSQEQPDAMVVSGDIYHYSTPSATAQRMYTDGLLNIHKACPEMTIVITAGNHDSSSKLEIDSNLWNHFKVRVVGCIERNNDEVNFEKHIIEVNDRNGKIKGYIIALPHVYPQNYPILNTETPREQRQEFFIKNLQDRVKAINTSQLPVVMMAHLSVEGSNRTGHDETVGGIEYVSLNSMGDGFDYLALGHIHCPQNLIKDGKYARYCGTPLPVSFDEAYPHSVSIVQVESEHEPTIKTVDIVNLIPLITLPKEPVAIDEAIKLLEDFPDDKLAYIRLNVLIKDYLAADYNERASNATKNKQCIYCGIKPNREKQITDSIVSHISVQEIQETNPLDIAKLYYKESEGEEMDTELSELMNIAMQMVTMKKNM